MIPPDFPWRAGMRVQTHHNGHSLGDVRLMVVHALGVSAHGLREDDRDRMPTRVWLEQCTPDPTDGATKGALLEAVREAWGFEDLSARRCSRGIPPGAWREGPASTVPYESGWGFDHDQGCVKAQELARRVGIQPSEFAALLTAWDKRPR